jgi:hypothetical protein
MRLEGLLISKIKIYNIEIKMPSAKFTRGYIAATFIINSEQCGEPKFAKHVL